MRSVLLPDGPMYYHGKNNGYVPIYVSQPLPTRYFDHGSSNPKPVSISSLKYLIRSELRNRAGPELGVRTQGTEEASSSPVPIGVRC